MCSTNRPAQTTSGRPGAGILRILRRGSSNRPNLGLLLGDIEHLIHSEVFPEMAT